MKFDNDGWPTINDGHGPSARAPLPLGESQHKPEVFIDEFHGAALQAGWQWPQNNKPKVSVKQGGLNLTTAKDSAGDVLGAILARSTISGTYTAETVVETASVKAGESAGIAAIGDRENATGLALSNGKLLLWRRDKGIRKPLVEIEAPKAARLHLRLTAEEGHIFHFAASVDGKKWTPVGVEQRGDQLPPWDRSIRVGLTVGGSQDTTVRFDWFRMGP